MTADIYEAAEHYAQGLGWGVLPVRGRFAQSDDEGKRPAVPRWAQYQKRAPAQGAIVSERGEWGGVAMLTGPVSGDLVVLDVDEESAIRALERAGAHLPVTVCAVTPRGLHYYYQWRPAPGGDGEFPASGVGVVSGIDVRGLGGYVVAPPTVMPSGAVYHWAEGLGPDDVPLAPAPAWLRFLLATRGAPAQIEALRTGVPEGSRNDSAARVVGWLLADGRASGQELRELLGGWNSLNAPALPDAELLSVIESIEKLHEGGQGQSPQVTVPHSAPRRESAAVRMISLTVEAADPLFTDQTGEPYGRIRCDGHYESWPLESRAFRRWLAGRFFAETGKAPRADQIRSALGVLAHRAAAAGPRVALHNRVAWGEGGALWYDLSDADWRAIRLTPEGWGPVADPPLTFRRFEHQLPQVPPEPGVPPSALWEITRLINVREDDRLLFLTWLCSCMIPDIPHPVVVFSGPQGSAKTSTARLARGLVDPSVVPVLAMPTDAVELILLMAHHWMPLFDNVGGLPAWASDHLCRAATGEGFAKRRLYTDEEEVLFSFRRCPAITGVAPAIRQPDLFDRLLRFELPPIPASARETEAALDRVLSEQRSKWVGALLSAVSAALALRDGVTVPRLPRMADFAVWGEAIAIALGADPGEFLDRYAKEIIARHDESIGESSFAEAVRLFAIAEGSWEGGCGHLLAGLTELAAAEGLPTSEKSWPQTPGWLSRRLQEIALDLDAIGVHVERLPKGTAGRRRVRITYQPHSGAGFQPAGRLEACPTTGVAADAEEIFEV